MEPILYLWFALLTGWLFLVGCAVGSFLNVCIYRLPRGKALTWPSSRCGACLAPIRLSDNVPLLSYWRLRGRCRACGARFSMRYFWVELGTGVMFAGLYWLEVGWNLHGLPVWADGGVWYLGAGQFPPGSWALYVFHTLLASLLLAALGCLIETGTLPRGLVVIGVVMGLLFAMLYPWPTPYPGPGSVGADSRPFDGQWAGRPLRGPMPAAGSWVDAHHAPRPGFVPWPIWGPLPLSFPPGSIALGLATGLAGALGGAWLLRGLGSVQRWRTGEDRLSLASGVVLLAGGFLGWQPMLLALILGAILTLLASRPRQRRAFTFAAALIPATFLVWLTWAWLGPATRPLLFDPFGALAATAGAALLAGGITWPMRGRAAVTPAPVPPSSDSTAP